MKKVKPHKDMTGKRQPNVGRSAPNLGQREAEMEKVSETKLARMKATTAYSAPGRFIAWGKQEQASIQQQLELMIRPESPRERRSAHLGIGRLIKSSRRHLG